MAYFLVERELRNPDFHDGVVRSFIDDLVLQNAIGRIKGDDVEMLQHVEVQGLPVVYDAKVAEGKDFEHDDTHKIINPTLLQVMEQFRSKGYSVTRLRQMIGGPNEKKGKSAAMKRAVDARNLAISIERALSSEQEAVLYNGEGSIPVTRGLMSWLAKKDDTKNTAALLHPVCTVHDDLIPVAGYDGNVDALTEALFKEELIKAKQQVGGSKLNLLGLVGIRLKSQMSEWLGKSTNVTGMDNLIRANRNADDKKLTMICDEFEYDGVRLKVMCDDNLLADPTSMEMTEAGYKSGAFIRPEMWGIQTLLPITHYDTIDNGAGPGGYHDAVLRLTCLNPMGQFRVKHVA